MKRDWRILILERELRLVLRRSATPAELESKLPAGTARRWIRTWARTVEIAKAKALLSDVLGGTARLAPLPGRTSLDWFIARVEQKIEAGDLIGVLVVRPTGSGIRKEVPAEPLPPPEPATKEPEEADWIEIELVDVYGEPVPNEAFRLELADGVVKTGKLNARGLVRFDGIPPGTCKVTFSGFDGREWRPA